MSNKEKNKRIRAKTYIAQLLVYTLTIGTLFIAGLIIPLRPEISERENRKLAEFPKFTFSSLFDGSYFRGIGDWYSDTFPGREMFLELNDKIKSFYKIGTVKIDLGGDIGTEEIIIENNGVVSDEVPTGPANLGNEGDYNWEIEDDPVINESQLINGMVYVGDTAYETVGFNETQVNKYITVVNKQAENLNGIANVYCLVIPKHIGITTSLDFQKTVGSADQEQVLSYIYGALNSNVNKVQIFKTLRQHKSEYLYFRTDHHWTALGAYYAYSEFTKTKGITTHPLSKYTEVKFEGFLGTLYNGCKDATAKANMKANPDYVMAYRPNANAELVFTQTNGQKLSWPIVADGNTYSTGNKYLAFIGGDQPFTEITNPDITDGSSIVVIKESFGNAFVPFLVENYHKVYVVDYRHYGKSISEFVKANGVQDVLYINNISAVSTSSLVNFMYNTL